jgi:phage tail-like protein
MRYEAIERLLPPAYQREAMTGTVLGALLHVMQDLHAPDEAVLETVDDLFTAYQTRERLLPFLARWLALDHLVPQAGIGPGAPLPMPAGRLRNLVAKGAALAQRRGTPDGLCRTLEIATGVTGFTIEEPVDRPYHFVVRVPQAAAGHLLLIRRIVDTEKPAATTAEVPDPSSPGSTR